ncbi:MAG TPA: hypothetical protein VFD37_03265 [Solirubrobacterales bacterium]|nr:hypothetical protein [Solirubrobacterales bacterium]
MKRVTISVPDETLDGVRQAVDGGAAPNVSAFLTDAANAHLREASMLDLLDQLDAELGAPSPEDVKWAESVLSQ